MVRFTEIEFEIELLIYSIENANNVLSAYCAGNVANGHETRERLQRDC